MRNEYRITRGRDGRLIVKPSDEPIQTRWRLGVLVLSLAVLIVVGNMLPVSGALSTVAQIPAPLFEEELAQPDPKIVLELTLPGQTGYPMENMETGQGETESTVVEAQFPVQTSKHLTVETPSLETEKTSQTSSHPPQETASSVEPSVTPNLVVHEVTVMNGDSLYTIFDTLGIHQRELVEITKGEGKQLRRIQPGQTLTFHVGERGNLDQLVYQIDEVRAAHFVRTESNYEIELVETPFESRRALAQGRIDSSLFLAGQAAGLPDKTIMEMAEIFGWDVDFALDIRAGDQFIIIYEELYKDDKKIRNGAILGAEFVNQGRYIRALRYTNEHGRSQYFSPEGDSMRKAFLRTPVAFSRISSYFGKRKHPVLSTVRNHNGVDYAAPTGTPIKATGDGRIEYAGRKGGYGRAVIVRHGNKYTTLYAHMSKFAKGVKSGKTVHQGQVIGYVGSSGLATGPHLHYEFQVRGVHRNPLKVELPKSAPIAAEYLQDFKDQTRELALQLDSLANTQITSNE